MKYRLFIFFILLLCSGLSHSQTLYELKYHFNLKEGREDYKALVLRNEDGTGVIRMHYTDLKTHTKNIVESTMEEHYGTDDKGADDSTILIFVGLDQVQIAGNVMYKPDHFVFRLSDDGYFEPDFVLSINDDNSEDIGELDSAILLNRDDLTEELVLQYFTENDEFYQNLFVAEVRDLTPKEKETKLHLLLVANTNDKVIGKACATDKETTQSTFGELAEFMGIGFVPTIIDGATFSKLNVEKAINAIKPGPNDIVVFYYSGHGFSDQKDGYSYPYMDLRDKSYQTYGGQYAMNMEAVYQKIRSKGARLNLVLSDCCNNDPSQTNNITVEAPSTRVSSLGWDKNKCLELFMNPKRQSVLMTAAQKGELSAGNSQDGGFFTFNFRQSMEKNIGIADKGKGPTWTDIMTIARTQTIARANRTKCRMPDESLKTCVQNPVFKLD